MDTKALIAQLSRDLTPTRRHGLSRRLCGALSIGAAGAFGIMLATIGLRPDLGQASGTLPFWIKTAFTLSLVYSSLTLVQQLARPAGRGGRRWWGFGLPIVLAAVLALGELGAAPLGREMVLIVGQTSWRCVAAIPLLALPIFLALLWAFRQFAPTRLRVAGAASGLLAGSAAASVYALACPESATAFMVTWYTLSILVIGAVGAAIGPRTLRW